MIVNLGHCIKNNAAANVFNKDLDARNYGVSLFHKVYLFDYDALEPLTRVKVRSNAGRFEGEDDVPDWFYEDGVVFLPEEIESGFRLRDRALRRLFRDVHGDLMTPRLLGTNAGRSRTRPGAGDPALPRAAKARPPGLAGCAGRGVNGRKGDLRKFFGWRVSAESDRPGSVRHPPRFPPSPPGPQFNRKFLRNSLYNSKLERERSV